jgi:hypothetical protein
MTTNIPSCRCSPTPVYHNTNDRLHHFELTLCSQQILGPTGTLLRTSTDSLRPLSVSLTSALFAPDVLPLTYHLLVADFKNPHTVDERMSIRGHLSTIKFFYQLLQNTQGWRQGQEE